MQLEVFGGEMALRGFEIYGVSERTYQRWERGDVRVPFDDVSAICAQVFKLGIDDIRAMIDGEE
jgi:hypothetical protein